MGGLSIARAQWRVLTLQFDSSDLAGLASRHLVYGILVTWVVGLGRYWDHPDPYLVQAIGLGSVSVMGALGLFLYVVIYPLRPAQWSLFNVYAFLSLTALPALLYAIPVERFLELEVARNVNVWFLGVVALWRVAMLARYLLARAALSGVSLLAAVLFPLALVVVTLTALNLEKAVFNIMAGLEEGVGTANDEAYLVLVFITTACFVGSPVLLALYVQAVWQSWKGNERSA